jgi:hypothetical protein
MMGFEDPFYGYSLLLRTIVYVLIPAFGILQVFRMRRALHVFQLEGYKRDRFLRWCAGNRKRALFLTRSFQKKPLVMTGRAWRLLSVAVAGSVALVLVLPGLAHLYLGGWPADVATWAVTTAVVNKRAGGMGLISGRKAFQRPMPEGVRLLTAIQDVYLCKEVTVA